MKKIREFIKAKAVFFILFFGAVLIFSNFSYGGLHGDDAIYSVRAIGNADFMFADSQPTPLQLFEEFPWWANLSNHDHPPLILGIAHIFLAISNSVFFARLPFAIFALLTLYLVYLLVKKGFGERSGLFASFLLLINPFFIWFAKISYLEMGVVFFLFLTLYLLTKALENKKYWLYFGAALGGLLITKYTALFILPALFFYFILKERRVFKEKNFYLAALIALIVISPVIIYNLMMFKELGHFDLQWAGVLGQKSPWSLDREISRNYLGNIKGIWNILADTSSLAYVFIAFLSLIYLFFGKFKIFKIKKYEVTDRERSVNLLFFTLVFLILFFIAIVPPELRFMPLFTPFMAILTAVFFFDSYNKIKERKLLRPIALTFAFIFLAYQSVFAINSAILSRPLGPKGILYARERNIDYGIYALDNYLDNLLEDKNVVNKMDFYKKIKRADPGLQKYKLENNLNYSMGEKFYPIVAWDPNINWFSGIWLFERRRFYDNLPFFSAQEFYNLVESQGGVGQFYFIKVAENGPITPPDHQSDFADVFEKQLIEEKTEVDYIYRRDGEVAFKVYKKLSR